MCVCVCCYTTQHIGAKKSSCKNFLHGQNNAAIGLDHEYDGICNVRIIIKERLSQLFSMLPQVLSPRGFSSH